MSNKLKAAIVWPNHPVLNGLSEPLRNDEVIDTELLIGASGTGTSIAEAAGHLKFVLDFYASGIPFKSTNLEALEVAYKVLRDDAAIVSGVPRYAEVVLDAALKYFGPSPEGIEPLLSKDAVANAKWSIERAGEDVTTIRLHLLGYKFTARIPCKELAEKTPWKETFCP